MKQLMPGGIWRFQMDQESFEGVLILTITGRVGSAAAPALRSALSQAARKPAVIVDLERVDYMSGAGLAELQSAAAANGKFVLCALTEPVQIAVELAGLSEVLRIEANRASALERVRHGV